MRRRWQGISRRAPARLRKRSFAHLHWFRTAAACARCRKIERTFARYSAMNDTLAVIACDALGCGCGNPQCPVVVAAVLTANGSLPRAAGLRQEQEDRAPAND